MSTQPTTAVDKLSATWKRTISPSRKTTEKPESRPTTSNGLLSPSPTSGSSISDDSRSGRSDKSGRRNSWLDFANRLRSPSNASVASDRSQNKDIDEIDNWREGFQRYNEVVSAKNFQEQAYPSKEFAKLSKALTKNCGEHFIHGLPEAAFDYALLWCPAGKLERKYSDDSDEPSWSWTAYTGRVNFPFDPTTCPDISKIPRSESEWFKSEIMHFHIGPKDHPYPVRRRVSKDKQDSDPLRIKYPIFHGVESGEDRKTQSNTLRFKAQTISANTFIIEQLQYNGTEIPCSQLKNAKNKDCGVIMDFRSTIRDATPSGPFEFVLLSRNLWRAHDENARRPDVHTMHPSGTPIWTGEQFVWNEYTQEFDDEVFQEGPWKMLNVMLIKWAGDFAERVAVGRIHEDEWKQHSPEEKPIALI